MPIAILTETADQYTDAATLGPSQQFVAVTFAVSYPNSVIAQIAKLDKAGNANWDENEFVIQPGTGQFVDCYGMRFRSFNPGNPTPVSAQAYFADDPSPVGLVPGLSSFSPTPTPTPPPSVIVVQQVPPTVTPIYIADPGAGVSSIDLYTVPANTLGKIKMITYEVDWDSTASFGDRAVLYQLVDFNGGPTTFAYAMSGNVFYADQSQPNRWLETDVGTMGNYLRSIFSTIPVAPINSDLDFEQTSAPFGDMYLPAGFGVRIIVPQMAATDEVKNIHLIVEEISAV